MELFQDEEPASSPSGQTPGTGGRTRLSIKPDKSREKSSKEHKKTVGCQVGPSPVSAAAVPASGGSSQAPLRPAPPSQEEWVGGALLTVPSSLSVP